MIAIVDYKMGNLRSVENVLRRLGAEFCVTSDADVIRSADKVLLPGVGNAAEAMENLRAAGLVDVIRSLRRPVLGICVGMQVMCRHSEEGNVDCLNIFDARVKRFTPSADLKVPHMGWNTIANTNSDLFKDFTKDEFVYFVHSFYVPVNNCTAAVTDYIHPFSAALHKDNFYATQFHPEKSGSVGERILKNFLEL